MLVCYFKNSVFHVYVHSRWLSVFSYLLPVYKYSRIVHVTDNNKIKLHFWFKDKERFIKRAHFSLYGSTEKCFVGFLVFIWHLGACGVVTDL